MALLATLVLCLAASAAGSRLTEAAAADASSWKEKPITKIVNLLKDMQAQLDEEGKEDQDMYDKMVCWCESNDKAKTKAIVDGQQKTTQLQSTIEEAVAAVSTGSAEVAALEADIAKLTKALGEAEAIRAKETAEFDAEQKDMVASVGSLKGAVEALGKQNSALQQQEALVQISQVLRRRPAEAISAALPHDREQLRQLFATPSADEGISLLQTTYGLRASAPASGAIFGMLSQMKETFETNLATGQTEEAQSKSEFESLKAAKTTEIAASSSKAFTKKEEIAKADTLGAQSKQDLDDTTAALAADTEFLGNLKKQCAQIDADFEVRTKARIEEVTAIGETIGILTDDEAQQAFSKSTSLLQLRAQSKSEAKAREATAKFLAKAGQRLKSPRLELLAMRVQGDAFAKIQENIDKMVGQLGKDGKDEEVHKSTCVTDLKDNGKEQTDKKELKEDLGVEIADLEANIATLTEEQNKVQAQVMDAQIELKRAGENRELENKDFQTTVQDQRATAEIVKKALDRMAQFYGKTEFLQQLRQTQPGPGAFKEMKKSGGGKPVMYLLEGVIKDAVNVEKDATEAEQEAQVAYETFAKTTNKMIEEMSRQLTSIAEALGKDEKEEVTDEGDKRHTDGDLRSLDSVADTMHGDCDWDIEHFSERQAARSDEVDALKESKAIFSGAMSALQEQAAADNSDEDQE